MSAPGLDLLALSPHLDDVVLSCGGTVAAAARRGERVMVATLFAGKDPPEPGNELALELARQWRLPPGGVIAARRLEDEAALARLGATALHADFPEALYRLAADGRPACPTRASLFRPPGESEAGLLADLVARLKELPPSRRTLAPLGVGGHLDHRLLRAAAERAFGAALEYYEEFPYVVWKWLALRRARGSRRGWEPEVISLDDASRAAKREAILAYGSQIAVLFGDDRGLDRLLERHERRAGGERFWRRRSTGPSPRAKLPPT